LAQTMDPQDRRLLGKTSRPSNSDGRLECNLPPNGRRIVRGPDAFAGNRMVRVFFYIDRRQRMVLLHGIVKKTRATPDADLDLARQNMRKHEKGLK